MRTRRTAAGPQAGFGAVILAGGTAARLGGADKKTLEVDGATLLERALVATAAATVVVVGEPVTTSRPVGWTREEPPLGGPAAGLLSGLDAFGPAVPELVCVLAVDMPHVGAETVGRLRRAVAADPAVDGAVLVDATGRMQPLAAVYRSAALSAVRPPRDRQHGLAVRRLVARLRLAEVAAVGDEAHDVDTWTDLRAADRRQG